MVQEGVVGVSDLMGSQSSGEIKTKSKWLQFYKVCYDRGLDQAVGTVRETPSLWVLQKR